MKCIIIPLLCSRFFNSKHKTTSKKRTICCRDTRVFHRGSRKFTSSLCSSTTMILILPLTFCQKYLPPTSYRWSPSSLLSGPTPFIFSRKARKPKIFFNSSHNSIAAISSTNLSFSANYLNGSHKEQVWSSLKPSTRR